jgi:anaerobic dimethyl sulfoxide reductase subunit A
MRNPEMFSASPYAVVEPLFECKQNDDVDAEFCKLFDLDPKSAYVYGMNYKENVFCGMANAYINSPDGQSTEPLISFTQEDLDEIGIEGVDASTLTEGRISYQDFKKDGFYKIEASDIRRRYEGQFLNLMSDPNNPENKLNTQTGFLEIYSMNLENYYQIFGLEHAIKATPMYPGGGPGSWEETLKGEYPHQYMDVHPNHRVHSTRYDSAQVLEYYDDVLFINPLDAEKEGLKTDDTVKLSSTAGRFLRRVCVTTNVTPGVIVGIQGAQTRLLDDEATTEETNWDEVIDYGGNANVLCPTYLLGQGYQSYNSVVVKMEKWTGEPLKPNYQWEPNAPILAE